MDSEAMVLSAIIHSRAAYDSILTAATASDAVLHSPEGVAMCSHVDDDGNMWSVDSTFCGFETSDSEGWWVATRKELQSGQAFLVEE
jgi:hypothetical protein